MKKVLAPILLLASTSALAGGGSSLIPSWLSTSTSDTNLFISNISSSVSNIKVTFYQQDGTVYNESSESGVNFTLYGEFVGNPLSENGATLEANKSGAIYMDSSLFLYGYGIIEWTSYDEKRVSILASGLNQYVSGASLGRSIIEINDNKPF